METITQKINSIIAARGTSLAKVQKAAENVSRSFDTVKKFERLQNKVAADSSYKQLFQGNAEILERIANISVENFYSAYRIYDAKIKQLTERFSRKELHITFIGRAGQGKSLVMQNISGLSGNVIPSAEGMDCTGAKSIITNDSNASSTRAQIEFFSQSEMIAIVNIYLDKIFHGKYSVGSISDIKNLSIDKMKGELDYTQVNENSLLATLEKYVKHVGEFENDLGTVKTVDEKDIEKYVAQFKNGDVSQKYFTYLGVKKANIICKFPETDAGKIVLVDTIGIGTTSLGTEDQMLDTVENDSDAIVFMFRPDPVRPRLSSDEIEIVDKVSKRISPEYAKEMFFWILNKVVSGKGENAKYIPELKQQISEKNFPVAKILEVDCKSHQAVEEELLTPILNQLATRISNVDELLIQRFNEIGEKLQAEFSAIANALDKVLVGAANEDVKRALFAEIKNAYERKILNALRDLYIKKYYPVRDHSCKEFEQASKIQLKNIFKSIPRKEKILDMLSNGTINQHNAVENCTDLMRIQIINNFMELNAVLSELVHNTKMEILHILADEDKGRLGNIYALENLSPSEWIEGFIEKTDCENKYPLIAQALNSLKNFNIDVQGFLIYEIRNSLDSIDFSLQNQTPEISASLGESDKLAEEIITWLKNYSEKVYDGAEIQLKKLNSVPNKAIFAATKDFYDRAAYAGKDKYLSVTVQWQYLYEDWMSVIWAEKYKNHFSLKGQAEEWDEMISNFKAQNKKEFFQIN